MLWNGTALQIKNYLSNNTQKVFCNDTTKLSSLLYFFKIISLMLFHHSSGFMKVDSFLMCVKVVPSASWQPLSTSQIYADWFFFWQVFKNLLEDFCSAVQELLWQFSSVLPVSIVYILQNFSYVTYEDINERYVFYGVRFSMCFYIIYLWVSFVCFVFDCSF